MDPRKVEIKKLRFAARGGKRLKTRGLTKKERGKRRQGIGGKGERGSKGGGERNREVETETENERDTS